MSATLAAGSVTSLVADGRRTHVVGLVLEGRNDEVGAVLAAVQSAESERARVLVIRVRRGEGVVRFSCLAGADPRALRREADQLADRAVAAMLALVATSVQVEVLGPVDGVQVAVAVAQRAGCSGLFVSGGLRPGARRRRRARRALSTALTIVPAAR